MKKVITVRFDMKRKSSVIT